jgi:hypothetical protein
MLLKLNLQMPYMPPRLTRAGLGPALSGVVLGSEMSMQQFVGFEPS